jgi:hypothetical protein
MDQLRPETLAQIEYLVRHAGRCLAWLDMGPISREQIVARVRECYGKEAAEVAAQLPWLNLH